MNRNLMVLLVVLVCGCRPSVTEPEAEFEQRRPQQAGKPLDPVKTAARMAAIRGSAILGDQEGVRRNTEAFSEDFRKSIKLADPARRVDREAARAAIRGMAAVSSAAWLDHENLFVIVSGNEARSYDTVDAICLALEPLGDTLGVVVNLQSGVATTGDELEILSRNCQLAPGDRAFMQRNRQVDVLSPEIRAEHRRNNSQPHPDPEKLRRDQAEAMRILEETTPEM